MNSLIYKRLLLNVKIHLKFKIAENLKLKNFKLYKHHEDYSGFTNIFEKNSYIENNIEKLNEKYNKLSLSIIWEAISIKKDSNYWLTMLSIPLGLFIVDFFSNLKQMKSEVKENIKIIKPYLGCYIRKKEKECRL